LDFSKISDKGYTFAFFGLLIIALLPFALCSPLPLADYPNHMARMHILANIGNSADLARYYALDWGFVPNLAMDVLVPPLIPLMSAESATMLFTAFTLFLMASGAIVLHRVLYGRFNLVPFAVFLLLYNRQFIWGFLNYLFSVGLALWLFAAHVYFRDRMNAFARILMFSVLAVILLVSHLHAFASYGILVACYEISIAWRSFRKTGNFRPDKLLLPAVQFIIPVVMFFALSRTAERASDTRFGGWQNKVLGFLDIFNNYVPTFDIASFLLLGALLAIGFYTRRARIHPDMRLSLAVLFTLYLILPSVLFSSYGADRRLLVMVALVLFASLEVNLESMRIAKGVTVALGLLFIARMGIIGDQWNKDRQIFAPVLASMDKIEKGSRVAVVVGGEITPSLQNPPMDHLGNMAVIKKDVYINSLFAEPGQQVLRLKNPASKDFAISPSQTYRVYADQTGSQDPFEKLPVDKFDYVLMINPKYFVPQRPPQLDLVFQKENVSLYRNVEQVSNANPEPLRTAKGH
jgi:hypothetical protein